MCRLRPFVFSPVYSPFFRGIGGLLYALRVNDCVAWTWVSPCVCPHPFHQHRADFLPKPASDCDVIKIGHGGVRVTTIDLSIDDTVVEKKKPSSQATRPMEGTGWHYSHLEGKQVYGYQVFGANISTGDFSLCYCLRRCCPENGSKTDIAVQLLDTLLETDARIIIQMDSWYTCKAMRDKALEKNITLIGAMKINRILYPDGHQCSRPRCHAPKRPIPPCYSGRSDNVVPISDATTAHKHADSKTVRREREKKIALGHKEDDHEDEQIWQQTM